MSHVSFAILLIYRHVLSDVALPPWFLYFISLVCLLDINFLLYAFRCFLFYFKFFYSKDITVTGDRACPLLWYEIFIKNKIPVPHFLFKLWYNTGRSLKWVTFIEKLLNDAVSVWLKSSESAFYVLLHSNPVVPKSWFLRTPNCSRDRWGFNIQKKTYLSAHFLQFLVTSIQIFVILRRFYCNCIKKFLLKMP